MFCARIIAELAQAHVLFAWVSNLILFPQSLFLHMTIVQKRDLVRKNQDFFFIKLCMLISRLHKFVINHLLVLASVKQFCGLQTFVSCSNNYLPWSLDCNCKSSTIYTSRLVHTRHLVQLRFITKVTLYIDSASRTFSSFSHADSIYAFASCCRVASVKTWRKYIYTHT